MIYEPIDDLNKVTINHYEAVIVAAKHARYLNEQRLAKMKLLEEGMEETVVDLEVRKITAVALRNLMEGKVQFERSDIE